MKVYSVIQSVNVSMTPDVQRWWFTSENDGQKKFVDLLKEVGEDYATLIYEEFDTVSGVSRMIDSFEGTEEDLFDEDFIDE